MKYVPMQTGMWAVFAGSFRKNLEAVFDLDPKTAGAVTAAAKKQYRRILRELPDFEKGDRFLMNIVSCAMLAAFILSMPERPNVERLREYYERSMMTPAMRVYCRKSGSRTYTQEYRDGMKFTAQFRAADRNPCSWNMDYFEYPDGSGFEARFTACGICQLMKKLGLFDLTPALCHLDYAMAEAGGATDFIREYYRKCYHAINVVHVLSFSSRKFKYHVKFLFLMQSALASDNEHPAYAKSKSSSSPPTSIFSLMFFPSLTTLAATLLLTVARFPISSHSSLASSLLMFPPFSAAPLLQGSMFLPFSRLLQQRVDRYAEIVGNRFYSVDARGSVLACPLSDCAVGNAARLFYGRNIRLVLRTKALDILINQKNPSNPYEYYLTEVRR